jgi:flagellar operon protein
MTMDGLTSNFGSVRDRRIKASDIPAVQPLPLSPSSHISPEKPNFQGNFRKVLDEAIYRQEQQESVQFSKHANMRLNSRQITLTGEQLSRVEAGLNKAYAKGIRDSLVLVDDVALVVNVKSKTVITALGHEQDNVFSNIDGAVIV